PSTLGSGQLARRMSKRIAGKKKLKRPANDLHYYTSSSEDNGDDDDGYRVSPRFDHISSDAERRVDDIDQPSTSQKNSRRERNAVFNMLQLKYKNGEISESFWQEFLDLHALFKAKRFLQNHRTNSSKIRPIGVTNSMIEKAKRTQIPRKAVYNLLKKWEDRKAPVAEILIYEEKKLQHYGQRDQDLKTRYDTTYDQYKAIIDAFRDHSMNPARFPENIQKQYNALSLENQEKVQWVANIRLRYRERSKRIRSGVSSQQKKRGKVRQRATRKTLTAQMEDCMTGERSLVATDAPQTRKRSATLCSPVKRRTLTRVSRGRKRMPADMDFSD
ncbi:MAG: hypothetical protein OXC30_05230, partial [Alphaproteobacteria bacterium]|nr:hypothetical protein [Alphaproteobacteria bacterium]